MKALVNFCVFGPDPDDIYYGGSLKNAELYQKWQPDWKLRFYLGDTPVDQGLDADLLKFPNTEVIHVPREPEDQTSTFWRFRALDTAPVPRNFGPLGPGDYYDAYFFRDVDSRPILRERTAVEQFLASDAGFHVMRDHLRHGAAILAGLWGVKAPWITRIRGQIPKRHRTVTYMMEQFWLARTVWPVARRSLMAHVDCKWVFGTHTYDFPSPRDYDEGFVGEGFYANDKPRFPKHRFEIDWDRNCLFTRGGRRG